jgi:hypothetical protein
VVFFEEGVQQLWLSPDGVRAFLGIVLATINSGEV